MVSNGDALYDRQKQWGSALVSGGLPAISACAAVGNCTEENKAMPVTVGPKDHGSDGGFQWRLDRLDGPEGLKPWCASQNMPWYTIPSQAKFFLWECRAKYPNLWRDLHEGVKKIETLTANIMAEYEIPNAQYAHLDQRISAAIAFRDRWIIGPVIITEPAPTPAPTGVFKVDPALITMIIQIGAPLIEALVKAILSAHGIGTQSLPGATIIHQQGALPPIQLPAQSFDPDDLVKKIITALTAAAKQQ